MNLIKAIKNHLIEVILVSLIIVVSIVILVITRVGAQKDNLIATVYYENKVIETIDLSKVSENTLIDICLHDSEYITVEVKKGAIRVVSANCKRGDCKRMGWATTSATPIICLDLHYKIVLSGESEVDVVLR